MKSYLFLLVFIFLGIHSLTAQTSRGAIIELDRDVHNYGTMKPDQIPDGKLSFTVYNKGDEPLIITGVRACCGTKVDNFTAAPIAVGDSGIVEISWRILPRPHRINRTVTITSNASNRPTTIARIQGEVVIPQE